MAKQKLSITMDGGLLEELIGDSSVPMSTAIELAVREALRQRRQQHDADIYEADPSTGIDWAALPQDYSAFQSDDTDWETAYADVLADEV